MGMKDLTGQVFGRWIVLNKTNKRTSSRGIIWHCKCKCGNEKDVDGYLLRSGQSKSCGCFQKELFAQLGRKSRIDLTGQRFGKLVALSPFYDDKKEEHTKWLCQCDCGNQCKVDISNLRRGLSKSCGCTQSREEEKIIKLLTDNKIPFQYQFRFNDFQNKKYDFYINQQYIIEYDGSQHFTFSGSGWDTREKYERTRQSDLEKNQYCFKNNIPLIRIPYNKIYTIEDLKIDTTHFLLTPDNESQYYNL